MIDMSGGLKRRRGTESAFANDAEVVVPNEVLTEGTFLPSIDLVTKPPRLKWDITEAAIAQAIVMNGGLLAQAANSLGIHYSTLSSWIEKSPKLKEFVKTVQENALDYAEDRLKQLISEKDKTAIIFYLKCKGRHRGWIDHVVQHEGNPDKPITFKYILATESDRPPENTVPPIEEEKEKDG